MVGLINTILLLYVLPAIIVYLSARVIYKYGGFLDDMGPLGLFLAMFVPYVNLFFVIIWGAIAKIGRAHV